MTALARILAQPLDDLTLAMARIAVEESGSPGMTPAQHIEHLEHGHGPTTDRALALCQDGASVVLTFAPEPGKAPESIDVAAGSIKDRDAWQEATRLAGVRSCRLERDGHWVSIVFAYDDQEVEEILTNFRERDQWRLVPADLFDEWLKLRSEWVDEVEEARAEADRDAEAEEREARAYRRQVERDYDGGRLGR